MPNITLNGNVIARAIGRYNPGLAFGADIFIAAGTDYESVALPLN